MFEFKLQIGCLAIVLYFIVAYIRGSLNRKVECSPIFDAFIAIAPWAIIFDGATAWSVNHQDIGPQWLNFYLHGLFLVSMDSLVILMFLHICKVVMGVQSRKKIHLMILPGILSVLSVIFTMKKIYYIEGKTTNYSMGLPVYICFLSLFLYLVIIAIILVIKRRSLAKDKILGISLFIILTLIILMMQILLPEILISALFPTITVIGLYMNFEDPALKRAERNFNNMICNFATLVESKDENTGGHIRRVTAYASLLANEMKNRNMYPEILTPKWILDLEKASPLHDIGKIAIPDSILQKKGPLTKEEYEIMKTHSDVGSKIVAKTFADTDDENYRAIVYDVARHHHEKWNGMGYPDKLTGKDIPVSSRITAIADVFDAVSQKRCYRDALPLDECFRIIENGRSTDFDPDMTDIFLSLRPEVEKICLDFRTV